MTWRALLSVPQVHYGGWDGHRCHWIPLGARKRLYATPDSFKTAVFEPFDVRLLPTVSGAHRSPPFSAGTFQKVGPTIDEAFSLKEFTHIFILGLLRAIVLKREVAGRRE